MEFAGNGTFTPGFSLTLASTKPPVLGVCPPLRTPSFWHLGNAVPYIVNAALNVPAIPMATLINGFVFLAIRRSTIVRFASKLLLLALLLTDVAIGLLLQPAFLALLLIKADGTIVPDCTLLKAFNFTSALLTNALLFTLTAISVDRYVALFYHVKYHHLVTSKRVALVLATVWCVSLVHAGVTLVDSNAEKVIYAVTTLTCFVVITVACTRIYCRLRHQHGPGAQVGDEEAQAHHQATAAGTLNWARYKHTASATMWVYALFSLCYLPNLCMRLVDSPPEHRALAQCIQEFFFTLLLLNASLNPVVYFLHLPGIRAEVLKQLPKRCF